ncbi:MAG: hypothetical protein U0326_44405 [Polyangiales bacterium]
MRGARPDERAPDPAPLEAIFPTIPPRAPLNDAAPKRPPLRLAHALAFVAAFVAAAPWFLVASAVVTGLAASPGTRASGTEDTASGPLARVVYALFDVAPIYVGSALLGLALGALSKALVGASSDEATRAARFAVTSSLAAIAFGVAIAGTVVLLTIAGLALAR